MELKKITQKLSSQNIDIQIHKELNNRKNEIEREIFAAIPELKTRIFTIEEVSKSIPRDGILIEFQRFEKINSSKEDNIIIEDYYYALTLNSQEVISAINLGPAKPIDKKIKQLLISSEQGFNDTQELLNSVSSMVFKPLAHVIADAKILFISPMQSLIEFHTQH